MVDRVGKGKIVVLQFHGVLDIAHNWVTTGPQLFEQYMQYLKDGGFKVIALKDLKAYLPEILPEDTMLTYRQATP